MTDPEILRTEKFGSRERKIKVSKIIPKGFGELILSVSEDDFDDFFQPNGENRLCEFTANGQTENEPSAN